MKLACALNFEDLAVATRQLRGRKVKKNATSAEAVSRVIYILLLAEQTRQSSFAQHVRP